MNENGCFAHFADDRRPDMIHRADEAGVLMIPGETEASFRERLRTMEKELAAVREETASMPPASPSVRGEALKIVDDLYGAAPEWVTAVHSTGETGRFSAGVTEMTENSTPVIFLSGAFLKRASLHGYSAAETLAHEMVHAVRAAFPDSVYDEYFSCQVHASRFRRSVGNFFRRWYIPVLFFGGSCAAVIFPLLAAVPAAIILREIQLMCRMKRAAAALRRAGLRPGPVLLRSSDREIKTLAGGKLPDFMKDDASTRRGLLFRRFAV